MKNKIILSFLVILSVASVPALANYYIDSQGQIYYTEDGSVLGRSVTNMGKAKVATGESNITVTPTPIVKKSQKIEVKNVQNQLKIQFVDQRNKTLIPVESSASSEITIEESVDTDKVTLTSTKDNSSQIIRNKIAAQTHFPLMVNLETNELIVTTPKGQKVVTILPDAAVAHMLAANVLDQAGGKGGLLWLASLPSPSVAVASVEADLTPTAKVTPEASPTPVEMSALSSTEIALTQQDDGTLTYEIPGIKNKKLFGFYPVTLQRTVVVSAETGELIKIRQSNSDRILDFFSR